MFSGSLCGFMAVRRYWPAREVVYLPCEKERLHLHHELGAQAQART